MVLQLAMFPVLEFLGRRYPLSPSAFLDIASSMNTTLEYNEYKS